MSIVDMNRMERDIQSFEPVPDFLRAGRPEAYAPRAVRDPAPAMTEIAKVHMSDLDGRVAAWRTEREEISAVIREAIDTADTMRRICEALQAELDSAHAADAAQPDRTEDKPSG